MTQSLLDAARIVGGYVWLEERLFEILGAWVQSVPEPEVKLRLAADSHHHAWHASLWRQRLPDLHDLPAEQFVAPAPDRPGLVAVMTALPSSPATIERMAAVYRVLLPHQVDAYQRHLERASAVSDGPTIRALQLVLADELADWRAGERLIHELMASAEDVQRACAHQARLESLLIGSTSPSDLGCPSPIR